MESVRATTPAAAPEDVADPGLSAWLATVRQGTKVPPSLELIRQLRKPRVRPAGPDLASVLDLDVPGTSPLKARLYRSSTSAQPLTVYVHGGGFVFGGLDSHDRLCRRLAQLTTTAVLAVDYRLAPEHRAPDAVDDVVRTMEWATGQPEVLGPMQPSIGLAGDSAGGLLAFLAARRLAGTPAEPGVLLLAYPNADLTLSPPSIRAKAAGWGLSADHLAFFIGQWLPDMSAGALADFSPVHGFSADSPSVNESSTGSSVNSSTFTNGQSMPVRTLLATAEHDPLRDEGELLATLLAASGTEVEYLPHPGLVHGFLTLDAESMAARQAGDALMKRYGVLLAARDQAGTAVGS